ncbi:hypothetical protein N480_03265 [Pseudoalteromonas luteoviolacea S2607]|uniref:TonB-dependent receptor plug domain-containing protein n=1 Tax=Pseudoalteromonas luteoviolacea TaxID=43657 RepID=UPI0007B0597F|nr:TonB-dependent receptor [Pseudoalteromonas luteoviolacea]KZN30991.1 hypothetical protein N480_03265 [Pseudoalteromonas luteoviolacea S2607]
MKYWVIFLILWVSSSQAKVIGKVTNGISDGWLNEVKVINVRNGAVAFTNEYGSFAIDASAGDKLTFSLRGFDSETLIAPYNKLVYAALEPYEFQDTGSLNSVLSTGGKQAQTLATTPASAIVITQAEITKFGYQTLKEVLNHISGLYLIEEHSWTGSGANVGVRGYMSSGVNNGLLIMINGVTQYEDYWGQFPLTRIDIPVIAIARIEVVRGPMSVTYGNQALLGTINIITRADTSDSKNASDDRIGFSFNNENDKRFAAKLSYEGNTNHTLSFGASTESGKFDTQSLSSSAEFASNYGDSLSGQSFFLGLSSNYRKNLVLNANLSQAKKGVLADLKFASEHFGTLTGRQYANINGSNFSMSYRHPWRDGAGQTKMTFGYYAHNSMQDYSAGGVTYGFASYRSKAMQFEWELAINGHQLYQVPMNLRLGGQNRRALDLHTTFDIGTDAPSLADRYIALDHDDALDTHSLFFQLDYRFDEKWLVDLGVRAERVSGYQMIFGCKSLIAICSTSTGATEKSLSLYERKANVAALTTEYTPRVALIYQTNPDSVFKVIYGVGARNPSFGQNADAIESKSLSTFSREQVKSLELIYLNQLNYDSIDLTINSQLSLFYSKLDNLIVRHGLESFARTGASKGVELSTEVTWRRLFARVGFNYYRAEDYQMDFRVPASPHQLAQLKIGKTLTDELGVGVSIRLIDRMYNSFSECSPKGECKYINPQRPYARKVWLVDMSFTKSKLFDMPVSTQFGVKNLFNTDHRYPISSNNAWLERGFPAEPRQVFMAFKYQL